MTDIEQEPTGEAPVPAGLVRIDAPDTLQGWKLVEIGSAEHAAAADATAVDASIDALAAEASELAAAAKSVARRRAS